MSVNKNSEAQLKGFFIQFSSLETLYNKHNFRRKASEKPAEEPAEETRSELVQRLTQELEHDAKEREEENTQIQHEKEAE